MRINFTDNISVMVNGENTNRTKDAHGNGNNKGGTFSINASQLNLMQDPIQARREKAQKEAMDILRGQFESDGVIDTDLKERRDRITQNKETASAALKEINAISDEQEKLKETYGIEADSKEQQDLELRMKFNKAMKPNSQVKLTEEEWEQYQELGPMTEYQKAAMSLEADKGKWRKEIEEAQKVISSETQVIRATQQEVVKHHGMDDAVAAKDKYLEAASGEIIGMLIDEGKDHIEEKVEEAVEKGEELKEEKEELEELREEKKAEREENTPQPEELLDIHKIQQDVEEQLKAILEEQKLLKEDLKGLKVNSAI